MSVRNPRGFVEYRHLGGATNAATRRYRVKVDHGHNQLFAGDPVVLVSGDCVIRAVPGTTASLPILGVVRAVLNSNGRPFTHSAPSGGAFIPASTAGYAEVNIDPFQTYLVDADATAVSTYVGQYCDITAGTPNTAAGRSGMSIKVASAVNTVSANTVPFQIIALGDDNLDGFVGGENNQDLEVIISNHVFTNRNKAR